MKRFILSMILIGISAIIFAQSKATCENYISNYDVPKELKVLPQDKVADFWWKRHWYDKKIDKVYDAKSKAAKNALHDYTKVCNYIKKNITPNKFCDLKYKNIIDKLNSVFNLKKIDSDLEIHVFPDNEFNASTYPTGFICINTGLIDKLDTMEIVAVVAHEIEHYVAKHSLNGIYAVKKRERNNKMWAELAGAVAATAYAYAGAQNAQYASTSNNQYMQNIILASGMFEKDAYLATSKYKMRYSREQEIEADIAAYRFLEFIGADPMSMIKVLDKIANLEGYKKTSSNDDHPSGIYRKNILLAIKKFDEKASRH